MSLGSWLFLQPQKCAHASAVLRYCIKRSYLFIDRTIYDPFILRRANYRTCKPVCPGAASSGSGGSTHSITYKPYVKKTYKDHDHKNMSLKRPMSPHLDIYRPTLPAMTSIVQRATGIGLSAFTFVLSAVVLSCPRGIDSLVEFIQKLNLPEPLIIAAKTVIAFVFTFHFFIGLRFVAFNLGKNLDLPTAYRTAYVAMALSAVTAVLCALIGHTYSFMEDGKFKVFPPKG